MIVVERYLWDAIVADGGCECENGRLKGWKYEERMLEVGTAYRLRGPCPNPLAQCRGLVPAELDRLSVHNRVSSVDRHLLDMMVVDRHLRNTLVMDRHLGNTLVTDGNLEYRQPVL
jgi:hypothetical protein